MIDISSTVLDGMKKFTREYRKHTQNQGQLRGKFKPVAKKVYQEYKNNNSDKSNLKQSDLGKWNLNTKNVALSILQSTKSSIRYIVRNGQMFLYINNSDKSNLKQNHLGK